MRTNPPLKSVTPRQVRGRLESLSGSLKDHRSALSVCHSALANDNEVPSTDAC